jgi:hypothetical protein
MSKRPHHIAAASWASIALEVRVTAFSRPHPKQPNQGDQLIAQAVERIEVTETKRTRTTVAGKWVFVTESKGGHRASR